MAFELLEVKNEEKNVIFNLMQLYTYELSFFEDETTNFTLLDTGLYAMNKYVNLYWKEESRHPYILRCDGNLAGFVLVRYNEQKMYEIAEFFVLNKYRRNGAGKFMADKIFEIYKGKWEIRTLIKNKRAQDFWRSIIKNISNDNFEEKVVRDNSRYAFYFDNKKEGVNNE